jgi:hypothetical protein
MSVEHPVPQENTDHSGTPERHAQRLTDSPSLADMVHRRATVDTHRVEEHERQDRLARIEREMQSLSPDRVPDDLEKRVKALNESVQRLSLGIPPGVGSGSLEASWLKNESYEVRDGQSCLVIDSPRVNMSVPPASQMMEFLFASLKNGLGPGVRYELTSGSIALFAPIDALERRMNRKVDLWSTENLSRSETPAQRQQFDLQLAMPELPEGNGSLVDAPEFNRALSALLKTAPAGTDKTNWGKVMLFGVFRKDLTGNVHFCVSKQYAAEFRRSAPHLFPDWKMNTGKDGQGGYRVRLNAAQARRLVRDAELRLTNDPWKLVQSEPVLKEALQKHLSPTALKRLQAGSPGYDSDLGASVIQAHDLIK